MIPKRVAVIDCGTNTFNILIAEKIAGKWKFICRRKRVVKLGSQGIKDRMIGPLPAMRALSTMTNYKTLLDAYNVKKVKVLGTSALRDARNGPALINKIRRATGLGINTISGDEEATYIYKGVKAALSLGTKCSLIMDIGGGSTEFILCNQDKIYWKKSYRLGAARLLEYIKPSDPIKTGEVNQMNLLLEKELASLIDACITHQPHQLIGSSGSFETFAAMILKKSGKKPLRGNTFDFNMKDYNKIHKALVISTYKERLALPGLLRMRADMILPASLLLTFVLRKTKLKKLILSTNSLKEGVLEEMVQPS